jgi:hypothetical protein
MFWLAPRTTHPDLSSRGPRLTSWLSPDRYRGNDTVLEHLSRAKQRLGSRLRRFAEPHPQGWAPYSEGNPLG